MNTERSSLVSLVKRITLPDLALILAALPFVAFFVGISIDLTTWVFTGHELFPWIGKALNG